MRDSTWARLHWARRTVRVLAGEKKVTRRLTGTSLRVTFPAGQYMSLLLPGAMSYEPGVREWLLRSVRPGDVCCDVGANIGLHALTMGSLVGPSGRVLAFEPDPQSAHFLVQNLTRNGLTSVEPYTVAVGAKSGIRALYLDTLTPRTTSFREDAWSPDGQAKRSIQVATVSLDDLELDRVNLIKIDVEGAELEVLEGSQRTLRRTHPVVVVEVLGKNVPTARKLLSALGYDVHALRGEETPDPTRIASCLVAVSSSSSG